MLADAIVDRAAARLAVALAAPRTLLRPLVVEGHPAGYLDATRARRLAGFPAVFDVRPDRIAFHAPLDSPEARTETMDRVARTLAAEGALTRWRDERYDVARAHGDPPWFRLERAAARYFGIATHAAHVNATTTRDGEVRMWIARRSSTKPIDPGLLDNLVGGGIASGLSIGETVLKEAREEAGIPRALASTAQHRGTVKIFREQPDGVQRETVYVYDLALPPDFVPRGDDGEVADYRLAAIDEVARWIGDARGDPMVTDDASLVIVDWLLRHGYVRPSSAGYGALDHLRG